MSTIVLSSQTTPAVATLAQVIWNALTATKIVASQAWPFSPDSLNFSTQGDVVIKVDGRSGVCTYSFNIASSTNPNLNAPIITGTLDLTLLQAQLL